MERTSSYKPADYAEIVRQAERERARVLRKMIVNAGTAVKTWFSALFGASTPKAGRTA